MNKKNPANLAGFLMFRDTLKCYMSISFYYPFKGLQTYYHITTNASPLTYKFYFNINKKYLTFLSKNLVIR